MRPQAVKAPPGYRIQATALYTILGFIIFAALAVAFVHTHDYSASVLPKSAWWHHWVNAVVAELLPVSAAISARLQWVTGRSVKFALGCVVGSVLVSGASQLYAADRVVPGAKEFFAVWPAVAALLIGKLVWSEVVYGIELKAAAAEEAEREAKRVARAAQDAQREAAREAARAERVARDEARREAEKAARAEERRLAREAAREDARLAHERAMAAQQLEAETARAAAQAAAQAEVARAQVEAQRVALQARLAEQAARQPADQQKQDVPRREVARNGSGGTSRRPVAETALLAQAVLDKLGDVPRGKAVHAVAQELQVARRTATQFVPAGWPAVRAVVVPSRSADGTRHLEAVPAK